MAKIFVIDDEPILLDVISAALRLDGHIVSTTADPLAASATILAEHPDVLIIEANMAPISGFQLSERSPQPRRRMSRLDHVR